MRVLQILGAIFILFATPAMAKDAAASWVVTQKSGDVRVIRNGLQPASVALKASLSPGDIVATGANGRAMLTRGDDYVVVAPASRLALPAGQQASGFTRLIHQVGTMLYKVRRAGVPHFAVETPMLAAVVKGTTFTIVVDQKGAAVQVTEGVVEVSSLTGNSRRLVEGGMAVYVGRERPDQVIEIKSDAVGLPEAGSDDGAVTIEGSGDVSLSTIDELSNGLVREAPTSKVVAAAPATVKSATLVSAVPTGLVASVADVDPANLILGTFQATVPASTEPVLGGLESVVPSLSVPVVDLVQATLPAITQPLADIVASASAVVQPVTDIIASAPAVTQPVIELVAVVPAVTEPIVDIVTAIPTVTQPIVDIVSVVPVVAEPIVDIVAVVPIVTQPVIDTVQTVVPVVTQPVTPIVEPVTTILCTLLCRR